MADFLRALVKGVIRDLVFVLLTFVISTGATAVVCWFYGIPLAVSVLGGILVLGLALAIRSDSIFDPNPKPRPSGRG